VKRFGFIYLAALALLISDTASAAQKTIGWEDGAQCEFETRFDPAKYDEEKLRNTIDVIFGDGFYTFTFPIIALDGPGGHLRSNTADYQRACELTKEKAINLPVIDLPGIEDYRKLRLEELEDSCRYNTLESRAASGDPAALREYTPSVKECSVFIDALEGKTDIRAVWHGVINSQCQKSASPEWCKADFLKHGSAPNSGERIKYDVLEDGWNSCSVPYLKTSDLQKGESMRMALEKQFRRRFRIKAFPCAD
jgi:hypothetical protein